MTPSRFFSIVRFPALVALTIAGLWLMSGPAGPVAAEPYCTGVPDFGPGYDFSEACRNHDTCYAEFGQPLPMTPEKEQLRASCDSRFLAEMLASCLPSRTHLRMGPNMCISRAQTYYMGVRAFGALFFYHEQNGCSVTPAKTPAVPAAC